MTVKRAVQQCGNCGAELPRRAKSLEKKPMELFGMTVQAVIRTYECRQCGERKAMVEATC